MPRKTKTLPTLGDLLTTSGAEQYSGLSRRSLHRLADSGQLTKFYAAETRLRWSKQELDALVTTTGRSA